MSENAPAAPAGYSVKARARASGHSNRHGNSHDPAMRKGSSTQASPAIPDICSVCHQSFGSRKDTAAHAKATDHLDSRYCRDCHRLFANPASLHRHVSEARQHQPPHVVSQGRPADNALPHGQRRSRHPETRTTLNAAVAVSHAALHPSQGGKFPGSGPPGDQRGSLSRAGYPSAAVTASQPKHIVHAEQIDSEARYKREQEPRAGGSASASTTTTAIASSLQVEDTQDSSHCTTKNSLDMTRQRDRHPERRRPEAEVVPPMVPPKEYASCDISPIRKFKHGSNEYSAFSHNDHEALYEALKLRVHPVSRLTARHFLHPWWPPEEAQAKLPKPMLFSDFRRPPEHDPSVTLKRRIVALDCEMVGVEMLVGEVKEVSELGQLCVVDVLTGEVLINKLVCPTQKVINWRTPYSGLSPKVMRQARAEGRVVDGWLAARAELFQYIDTETIVMGHNVQSDLTIMRALPHVILDTSVQTSEAVFGDVPKLARVWGLKGLAKTLLGMGIQMSRKTGHDCVEDTLATREVAIWCVLHLRELEEWAVAMRQAIRAKALANEEKRVKAARERLAQETARRAREARLAAEQDRQFSALLLDPGSARHSEPSIW